MKEFSWGNSLNKTAIALHYTKENPAYSAPYVSAKGSGDMAEEIIALAKLHDIPIFENPALTAFLGNLQLEEEIPPLLYQVIAEMIAFAYSLKQDQ